MMLYIHVPFCKSRCIYCDFYSTTCLSLRTDYVEAVCNEIHERTDYLPTRRLDTIYLGGGTPSQLSLASLETLFECIKSHFDIDPNAEVTVETNPDDVTPEFVEGLHRLPVNRVSLGVQTFSDEQLQFLHRRHSAAQVNQAVQKLHDAGYSNISIDLIYGLPGQTLAQWSRDVDEALSLPVQHLSAYALIYEEGTQLWRLREQGSVREAEDELSLAMFECLIDKACSAGFEHYEISNFARPGMRSRHNSGYWDDVPYLGVGPGAHSFNGVSRRWNNPDLNAYVKAHGLTECCHLYGDELLTEDMLHNETVMKRLRTCEGIDLVSFEKRFGERSRHELLLNARPYINKGELLLSDDNKKLRLSRSGIFISDGIMSALFR